MTSLQNYMTSYIRRCGPLFPKNVSPWTSIEHAAGPKLTKHLRVGGQFDIGSITPDGVSHRRLAVGVAAVNRHRGLVSHAGT